MSYTTNIYPKTGNPSGFILPTQTGNFVTTGDSRNLGFLGKVGVGTLNVQNSIGTTLVDVVGSAGGSNLTVRDTGGFAAVVVKGSSEGDMILQHTNAPAGKQAFYFRVLNGNFDILHLSDNLGGINNYCYSTRYDGRMSMGFGAGNLNTYPAVLNVGNTGQAAYFSGNVGVTGVLTASNILCSGSQVTTAAQTGVLAANAAVVHLTGDETINGIKSFNSPIKFAGFVNVGDLGGGVYGIKDTVSTTNTVAYNTNINGYLLGTNNGVGGVTVRNSKVGINDFDPIYTLDVSGSGNFSSALYVSGQNINSYFYPRRENPSGYIAPSQTGRFSDANTTVFTTGQQIISGEKTFSNKLLLSGTYSGNNLLTFKDNGIADGSAFSLNCIVDPLNGSYSALQLLGPTNHQIYFGNSSFRMYEPTFYVANGLSIYGVSTSNIINIKNNVGAVWGICAPAANTLEIGVSPNNSFWKALYSPGAGQATNTFSILPSGAVNGTTLLAKGVNGQVGPLQTWQTYGGQNLALLTANGQLGINHNTPVYQLDVSGSGNFTSGLFVSNIPVVTGMNVSGATQFNQQYSALEKQTTTGVNWNNGNVQYYPLVTGVQSLTFTNPLSGGRYILILKQPASGLGATISWPSGVLWSNGTTPQLTTGNSKVDLVSFIYDGINAKYYGNTSLNF